MPGRLRPKQPQDTHAQNGKSPAWLVTLEGVRMHGGGATRSVGQEGCFPSAAQQLVSLSSLTRLLQVSGQWKGGRNEVLGKFVLYFCSGSNEDIKGKRKGRPAHHRCLRDQAHRLASELEPVMVPTGLSLTGAAASAVTTHHRREPPSSSRASGRLDWPWHAARLRPRAFVPSARAAPLCPIPRRPSRAWPRSLSIRPLVVRPRRLQLYRRRE